MLFKDLDPSILLVDFTDARDKEFVIWEGSWSFDRNLVLVMEVNGKL